MPSPPLRRWINDRLGALNELEDAHRSVGGTGPGRRHATQQLNYAYTVLLSAHFQGFCRDLHDQCVTHLVESMSPPGIRMAIRESLFWNRRLNTGNPNPGNIGSDFNRLSVKFWIEVRKVDARNDGRIDRLEDLNRWRNAIAHQDFDPAGVGTGGLHLERVREWRSACDALAVSFDRVMRTHLHRLTGTLPW